MRSDLPTPLSNADRAAALARLAERLAASSGTQPAGVPRGGEDDGLSGTRGWPTVSTGWAIWPSAAGGEGGEGGEGVRAEASVSPWASLTRGQVHEWLGGLGGDEGREGGDEHAPMPLLVHLAWRALSDDGGSGAAGDGLVVWIGRTVWPSGWALASADPLGRHLLRRSLLVDARDAGERVWAMDLALRQPGVAAVIGDGTGLDMAASRRLQLAAASRARGGDGPGGTAPLALLSRPGREGRALSAAATRWRAGPVVSENGRPRWSVALVRRKGLRPIGDARALIVELGRGTSLGVAVVAGVERGTGVAELASPGRHREPRVA
jgi:hypothetical protein